MIGHLYLGQIQNKWANEQILNQFNKHNTFILLKQNFWLFPANTKCDSKFSTCKVTALGTSNGSLHLEVAMKIGVMRCGSNWLLKWWGQVIMAQCLSKLISRKTVIHVDIRLHVASNCYNAVKQMDEGLCPLPFVLLLFQT